MANCTVTPIQQGSNACSNKCKNSACGTQARVWVIAACDGVIALFNKYLDGEPSLLPSGTPSLFYTVEQFRDMIVDAEQTHAFDKLVFIGKSSDIAWLHACVPLEVTRQITAEIQYPLLAGWFKENDFTSLNVALKNIFLV